MWPVSLYRARTGAAAVRPAPDARRTAGGAWTALLSLFIFVDFFHEMPIVECSVSARDGAGPPSVGRSRTRRHLRDNSYLTNTSPSTAIAQYRGMSQCYCAVHLRGHRGDMRTRGQSETHQFRLYLLLRCISSLMWYLHWYMHSNSLDIRRHVSRHTGRIS